MTEDSRVRMRINKPAFAQYYTIAERKLGSQRKVAAAAGVTHPLIGQILKNKHKTHVNLDTALRFEQVFGAPSQIVFMPEVSPVTSNTRRKAAV